MTRSRRRSAAPSPKARQVPASGCRWPGSRRGARVNKNTVLRALQMLRDEGLLEFRRGRGIAIVGTPQRGAVLTRARELLDFARHHGFGRDELIQIIESLP
jgi:DNA-binding transcriptional regulator YhcF (GntR family)